MDNGNLDSQAIKKALNLKNSGVVFQRWVLHDSKSKIYVITTNRLHLLAKKPPHKVEFSTHILDINSIESASSQSVKITLSSEKSPKYDLKFGDDEDAILSISHIVALMWLNFPALDAGKTLNLAVNPEDRLSTLITFNDAFKSSQADVGPCNGFSTTYFSICNYFGQPSLAEVAWDIDKIYACHTCTEFNVCDFDHLELKELIPLIVTIGYNDWFKTFRCTSLKIGSDVTDAICRLLKMSISLESVILKDLHFSKETVQKLTTAIASNPNTKIKSFDLSENNMEDRGLVHLCGLLSSLMGGIEEVVLKNIGLSSKGSGTLATFFRSTKLITSSLTRLSLADNPLKSDGSGAISEFLSRPNVVKELDLSNTDCGIDLIFGALLRGCLQKLETLNLSGNPFSYKRKNASQVLPSLQQFFGSAIALSSVNLSNTKLPPEAAKAILLGLIGNNVVTCVSLDFSKNELRGTGASEIGNCLPGLKNLTSLDVSDNGFDMDLIPFCENVAKNTSLRRLNISQNVGKIKSSNVANVVESLVEMCLAESLPLEYLSVADNKLKQETSMLFDSLGANNSLQELDISGNAMGDEGARLLAKALQINTRLRILQLDRNGVSHKGYKDIANALKRNYSMQSIPTPIADMSQGLKHSSEQLQKHIHKIEKLLHRNMSMEKVNRDHFFRLQQNVMLGFLNQQRIDEMVVNLEDTIISAKEDTDEEVASEVQKSRAVVREAEKLKDVVHSICVDAISFDKNVESKMETMSDELSTFANDLLKKNIIEMLERVKEQCPAIFANKEEVENLQGKLIDESKVDISPIRDNIGKALYGLVLQKIKEASMSVASSIAEELTVIVHATLNSRVTRLKQSMKKKVVKDKDTKPQEVGGKKIKKNRLSLMGQDGAPAAGGPAANLKRRPTFHRNRGGAESAKEFEVSIDIDAEASPKSKAKSFSGDMSPKSRERISTATLDSVKGKEELSSLLKDRVKPNKGRRPPTRVSNLAHFASNETLDAVEQTDSGQQQEDTSEKKPETHKEKKPDPPAAPKPEPVVAPKPEPVVAAKPDPPSAQKPEPPSAHKPEPPSAHKPEPPSAHKPEPPSAHKPEPPSAHKPEPPSAHKPEPPSALKPDTTAAVTGSPSPVESPDSSPRLKSKKKGSVNAELEKLIERKKSEDISQGNKDETQAEEEERARKISAKGPPPKPPSADRKPTPKPRASRHKDDLQLAALKKSEGLAPESIPRSSTAPSRDFLERRKASLENLDKDKDAKPTKMSDSSDPPKEETEALKPATESKPDRSPKPMPKPRIGMPMIPPNVMNEIKQRQQMQKSAPDSPDLSPDKGDSPKPAARKRPQFRKASNGSDEANEDKRKEEVNDEEGNGGDQPKLDIDV